MKHSVIVCKYGWIISGIIESETETEINITDGAVVRKWTNGKGIGGLAYTENKEEYTLDYIGNVIIKQNKVLFVIPCEW